MPDGARFERGGEFVEAGYDHLRRRAAEYGLPLAAQGFEFGAREVRADGRRAAGRCCSRPSASIAQTAARRSAPTPRGLSAADALARAPLEPLARLALTRRLEGTYTVELDARLGGVARERRAARRRDVGEVASARLAGGNDALAKALAAELGDRVRLGCAIRELRRGRGCGRASAADGVDERFDRAVLAVPLPLALALLPALRERAELRAPVVRRRRQAARAARRARRARRGAGARGGVLDVDRERRGGRAGDVRLGVRGRRARRRRARARARRASAGSPRCRCSGPSCGPRARPC